MINISSAWGRDGRETIKLLFRTFPLRDDEFTKMFMIVIDKVFNEGEAKLFYYLPFKDLRLIYFCPKEESRSSE